jgi:hypothetical protein
MSDVESATSAERNIMSNEVEQHLLVALQKVALAETLIEVYGAQPNPAIDRISKLIVSRLLVMGVSQDMAPPTGLPHDQSVMLPMSRNHNGHDPTPIAVTPVQLDAVNGNGCHVDEVKSVDLEPGEPPVPSENATDGGSRKPESKPGDSSDVADDVVANSLKKAKLDVRRSMSGVCATISGIEVPLSPKEHTVLSFLLENNGRQVTAHELAQVIGGRGASPFVKSLEKKCKARGINIDGSIILKNGEKRFAKWSLNPNVTIEIVEQGDQVDQTSPERLKSSHGKTAELGRLAIEKSVSEAGAHDAEIAPEFADDTLDKRQMPALEFDFDISDRRERRSTFLRIANLDQYNAWVDVTHSIGKLPKVIILDDISLEINGSMQRLNHDQQELFNILLAHMGQPLSQQRIFELGFNDFESGGKRLKSFNSAANRLLQLKLDKSGTELVHGDKLMGTDFALSTGFVIEDRRPTVKKN